MQLWNVIKRLFAVGVLLLLPVAAYAQEATVMGTVTDETGGVLPGVSITALNSDTGNTFLAVTDERGNFRIPVRIGTYRITAELTGFGSPAQNIVVQVGQTAVVNLQMKPSGVEESVTVTGEAPLISATSATVGGNIDQRQMEDIPLSGRNWMDLALLAPGVRSIESSGVPDGRTGYSQINVDGQQVTMLLAGLDAQQPKYSRDAIAEFEIVTNGFDASQGRSAGFIVNAVTKSGTNTASGTFAGYFRDDKMNAADKVQNRVIPYQNQQLASTFGGPIVKDRLHYFGNYEYEREPNTLIYTHPLFPMDLHIVRTQHTGILRIDAQFTPSTRLSTRGQASAEVYWTGGGATSHPGSANDNQRYGDQAQNILTHVISNKSVNSLQVGWTTFTRGNRPPFLLWKGGCNPNAPFLTPGRCSGSNTVGFTGLSIGNQTGQLLTQQSASIRNDFTTSMTKGGRHDIKIGAEWAHIPLIMKWCSSCLGSITLNNNVAPPANVLELFPVWNDASTWNFAALSSVTVRVSQNVSKSNYTWYPHTNVMAGWLQDDWQIKPRVTLNLGVRYDLQTGAYSEKLVWEPWKGANDPYDTNNLAPRTGVVFNLSDKMVIRGGYGLFFTQASTDQAQQTMSNLFNVATETQNDGRANFAANWFNGPNPTFEQAESRMCNVNGVAPGCLRRNTASGAINMGNWQRLPYAHQASGGMQRQIGTTIGISADLTYTGGRSEQRTYNINRTFDRVTGDQTNFNTIALRAFPNWGTITGTFRENWNNYFTFQTALNKRMSHRWQASANYSFTNAHSGSPAPDLFSFANGVEASANLTRTPVDYLRFDVGRQYDPIGTAKHRLVTNGIWDLGHGMQVSGVYTTTDGGFSTTSCGCQSGTGLSNRQRVDGSIIPVNNFNRKAIHKVDVRFQKRLSLGGRRTLDGTFEVFNLLNHGNFSGYTTDESNPLFGTPTFSSNVVYQPRTAQLGFRVAF